MLQVEAVLNLAVEKEQVLEVRLHDDDVTWLITLLQETKKVEMLWMVTVVILMMMMMLH